jgi:hypothetical protein
MTPMNKNILLNEIQWLTDAIREQVESFRERVDQVPQIEFDMAMENIRKLYEKLHILQRMTDPYGFYEKKSTQAIPAEMPPEKQPLPSQRPAEKKETRKKEAEKESDLFSDDNLKFTQKLREARGKSLGPSPGENKKESLKSLISINEKFLFINELFDGNLRDYNENIETLGGFSELQPTLDYLDQLRNKNLWESESKAFLRLKEILEKKFM